MSRVRHPADEGVALEECCPTCYMPRGQWCLTGGGGLARSLHADRFWLAHHRYRGLPASMNDPTTMTI